MTIKKILYPTDGSNVANQAIPLLTSLAEKYQAEVILLNCYHVIVPEKVSESHYFNREKIEANFEKRGNEILNKIGSELNEKGIICHKIIKNENTGPAIIETSEQEKVDLIVMGNRGLGFNSQKILGSVSRYVLDQTDIPVLII